MKKAQFIIEVVVTDPDSNLPVEVSMFKHENGGIFGIDSSYIVQEFDDDEQAIIPDPFSHNHKQNIILKGV